MKFVHQLGLAIALFACSVSAFAAWEFDDAHSKAVFTVKHLTVTNVTGKITGIKGSIDIDDKDIAKSSVDVTLDVTTINTDNTKRDDHLKNPDFFDVKKFPVMKFKSTKVEKASEGNLKVSGMMTIRDQTKPVVFDVEGPSAPVKDPWGNMKRGLSATTKINRKDFGLTWNKSLDGGGLVVGDEVKIALEIELNEKKK
jgi:polyisoprenoid-binding protein YceI